MTESGLFLKYADSSLVGIEWLSEGNDIKLSFELEGGSSDSLVGIGTLWEKRLAFPVKFI